MFCTHESDLQRPPISPDRIPKHSQHYGANERANGRANDAANSPLRDARSSWKPKRQRRPTERGRGFALALYMLAQHRQVEEVLRVAFGSCSAGRAWRAMFSAWLRELPTEKSRVQHLEHWLRTFARAARWGNGYRVRGAEAYVGRKHLAPVETQIVTERFCETTGEVLHGWARKMQRPHCPKASAGALSAAQDRSARQLDRYREHMRDVGLMGSRQPKQTAEGAILPREEGSTWAYAHHWLLHPPSAEMLRQWGYPKAAAAVERVQGQDGPELEDALRAVLRSVREPAPPAH